MMSPVASAWTCCAMPAPAFPARSTARKATVVLVPSVSGARTPTNCGPLQSRRESAHPHVHGLYVPDEWQAGCAQSAAKPPPVSTSMNATFRHGAPPPAGSSVAAAATKKSTHGARTETLVGS